MNFEEALKALKIGEKVARKGWAGKNQYLEIASHISFRRPGGTIINPEHTTMGNKAIVFYGESGQQVGWLASQADLLSNDWTVV